MKTPKSIRIAVVWNIEVVILDVRMTDYAVFLQNTYFSIISPTARVKTFHK